MVDPVVSFGSSDPSGSQESLRSGGACDRGLDWGSGLRPHSRWQQFCAEADAAYNSTHGKQEDEIEPVLRCGLKKEVCAFEVAKLDFINAPTELLHACKRIIAAFAATKDFDRALSLLEESQALFVDNPAAKVSLGGVFVPYYQPSLHGPVQRVVEEVVAIGMAHQKSLQASNPDLIGEVVVPAMACLARDLAQDLSDAGIKKLRTWCQLLEDAGLTLEDCGMQVSYAYARQLVYAGMTGFEDPPSDAISRLEAIQTYFEDAEPTELLGEVQDTLGRAYQMQRRYSDANRSFERAIDTFTDACPENTDLLISPICGLVGMADLSQPDELWTELLERLRCLCSAPGSSWERLLGHFSIARLSVYATILRDDKPAALTALSDLATRLGNMIGAFGVRHFEVNQGLQHLAALCPEDAAATVDRIFAGGFEEVDVSALGLPDADRAYLFMQLGKFLEEIYAVGGAIEAYTAACEQLNYESTEPCSRNRLNLHIGRLLESENRFDEASQRYNEVLEAELSDNVAAAIAFRLAAARVALIRETWSDAVEHLDVASQLLDLVEDTSAEVRAARLECISWLGFARNRADGNGSGEAALVVMIRGILKDTPAWAQKLVSEIDAKEREYQLTRAVLFLRARLRDREERLNILPFL